MPAVEFVCLFHINYYPVVHFSMRDIFSSTYLYIISAARLHMEKVQHQLVFSWLIRASIFTLGTVNCIAAHINDTLPLFYDLLSGTIVQSLFF